MFWEYKNPILADVYDEFDNVIDTEKIYMDDLGGIELYGGLGLNLVQTRGFQFGVELSPGVIFWWFETVEGFDNDVFDPFLYTKLTMVFNFKLTK